MSTEDTPKPAAWTFGASYWTRAESIPLAIIAQAEPLFDQATLDAAVANECQRWEVVVFDGWRVLNSLDKAAAKRTTHQNVSDTLDALMRVLRA